MPAWTRSAREAAAVGATWLDRELVITSRIPAGTTGVGWEVAEALRPRAERLVETGYAQRQPDGTFLVPRNLAATLERQEVERMGREMAQLAYLPDNFSQPLASRICVKRSAPAR